MNIYYILTLCFVINIRCEFIEEEVIEHNYAQGDKGDNGKVPHHPGFSSNKNKKNNNRNVYHSNDNNEEYNRRYQQSSHPNYSGHPGHPSHLGHPSAIDQRIGHEQMPGRNLDDLHYRNLEHNNGHMDMGMGMPNQHMGGMGMGRHEGMNQHINHGGHSNFNSHNNNHQMNSNQFNTHNNSNSWFSGTFGTLYEIMMILFLLGLVYNCIFGRNQNDKHAMSWYNANRQYFEERYEHIGANKTDIEDLSQNIVMKDSVIVKENPYYYKLYCSKYRYIKWSLTTLEFRKRYDASSMVTSIFFSDTDKLIYQIAFQPVDPLGWVFCVCKKRDAPMIKRSNSELAFFTKNYDPSVMNERMCLLSENLEKFMELFQNKNLFPYYKQIEQFLDVICFIDQASFCDEPFAVFFSFDINLTYPGQERRLLEITHFVTLFVDTLAQLKYDQKFKKEISQNRIDYERSKMEEGQRKEIEEKEKNDFVEKWKIKNKMKYKTGAERKKLEKELAKYN